MSLPTSPFSFKSNWVYFILFWLFCLNHFASMLLAEGSFFIFMEKQCKLNNQCFASLCVSCNREFSHTKYPNAIGSNSVPPGLAGSAMLLRPAASRGRRIAKGNEEVSNFPEKGRTPRIQGSEKLANW